MRSDNEKTGRDRNAGSVYPANIPLAVGLLLASAGFAQDYTFQDAPPAGAPTSACTVKPDANGSKLRVLTGATPVTFVFACGHNRPSGQCAVMTMKPGGREMPITARFATQGIQQNGWTCVDEDGIMGWLPSDRLISLSSAPAVPLSDWMGWWRHGPDSHGIKSDRLLIARGKVPGTLHVSGRAYWYGANDNVHFGEVNADATPFGDTLHVVDGGDQGACVVNLVYRPATHIFDATDNMNCGGMNVRFSGIWQRFIPTGKIKTSTH